MQNKNGDWQCEMYSHTVDVVLNWICILHCEFIIQSVHAEDDSIGLYRVV